MYVVDYAATLTKAFAGRAVLKMFSSVTKPGRYLGFVFQQL